VAEPANVSDGQPAGFRRGVRLALDWGKARVGVAACDADGLLCYPVETVPIQAAKAAKTGPAIDAAAMGRIDELIGEYEPIELVLGWPIDLRGEHGPAVEYLANVAAELSRQTSMPIRLVDERMTTAQASRQLAASGKSARQRRSVIDQAAAVGILEQAVERERRTGAPAGRLFSEAD